MKCVQMVQESQCSGTTTGEAQEKPGLESPHSAWNLQVTLAPDPRRVMEHHRVKWPQANKEKERLHFDEDADAILESTAKREADRWNDHHYRQHSS